MPDVAELEPLSVLMSVLQAFIGHSNAVDAAFFSRPKSSELLTEAVSL
jgi:hypothetical protein